jgi:hypothetical protein
VRVKNADSKHRAGATDELRDYIEIAAVPFTLRTLKQDLEDLGSNFDGAPGLEFRAASKRG